MSQPHRTLGETIALIYEMEGMAGVEAYAKEISVPIKTCLTLLTTYFVRRLEFELGGRTPKRGGALSEHPSTTIVSDGGILKRQLTASG
jgi:hypothetical protein